MKRRAMVSRSAARTPVAGSGQTAKSCRMLAVVRFGSIIAIKSRMLSVADMKFTSNCAKKIDFDGRAVSLRLR